MNAFEHYRDTYHKEIDRIKTLYDSLTIPMAVITVLGTILTYYLSNFDYAYSVLLTIFFAIGVLVASVFLGLAIWFLWQAYNITGFNEDRSYHYLPPLEQQETFYQGLVTYYSADEFPVQDRMDLIETEFNKYLKDAYVAEATNNFNVNNLCQDFLFKCKAQILRSLFAVFAIILPFGINYALKPEHPTLTKIVKDVSLESEPKKQNMAKPNNSTPKPTGTLPAATPGPNSQGVQYPARPTSVHVKNGQVVKPRTVDSGKTLVPKPR